MSEKKYRFALIGKFEKKCKEGQILAVTLNKYKEQWAADDLLESYEDKQLDDAMVYYFKVNPRPTWKGYCNNVDRLIQSIQTQEDDKKFRAEMRQKAREWLNES